MSAPEHRAAPVPGKILSRHLERLGVVYIRQSTPWQVLGNRESTDLQYQPARRAVELGWRPERVLVIDDDLGRSGASAADRAGFRRLLAEVGLDYVSLIPGSEMSRPARSRKDWYHLLELEPADPHLDADRSTLPVQVGQLPGVPAVNACGRHPASGSGTAGADRLGGHGDSLTVESDILECEAGRVGKQRRQRQARTPFGTSRWFWT
jgi:hypothetical protein